MKCEGDSLKCQPSPRLGEKTADTLDYEGDQKLWNVIVFAQSRNTLTTYNLFRVNTELESLARKFLASVVKKELVLYIG